MKDETAVTTELREGKAPSKRAVSSGWRTLTFDAARYEAMINDLDLSDDQRQELLAMMWNLIVGFVDLGFEVKMDPDPEKSCGQDSSSPTVSPDDLKAMIDCEHQPDIAEVFSSACAGTPAGKEKA